jgi:hypothetical protein
MTVATDGDQRRNVADAAGDATTIEAAPPRRPYHAPRLRHLGSVRELTLGSAGALPDDESTQQA